MRNADSVNDLRLSIKLAEGGVGSVDDAEEEGGGLSLKDADDDSYKVAS